MAKYCKRCEGLKTPDTWDDNRLCELCLLEIDVLLRDRYEQEEIDLDEENYDA